MLVSSSHRAFARSIIVLLALGGSAAASEKEDVIAFLKQNVMGRKVEHRSTDKLANNTLETDFIRQTIHTNLQETSQGFSFDVLYVVKQTIWDLDKEGKRQGQGRHEDRVLASRYEFKTRKSTGRLLGCMRGLTNSFIDPIGDVNFAQIELKNDRLIITESTVGYGDYFGKGGKYDPASSDIQTVMELKEGKLYRRQTVTSFNIDPETLQRTSQRDEIINIDLEIGSSK